MSLAFPVDPMKAKLGSLPADDDDGWAYEIKWDGYRTLVHIDGPSLRLQSSSGRDVSQRWSEVAPLADSVNAERVVLDGELVVLDDAGHPSFSDLQRATRPAVLQLFDVLAVDDHDVVALPYEQRRALLEQLVEPGQNWSVPRHRVGGGAELLAATRAQGLEGVMAKRLGSPYRVGARSSDWLKIKNRWQLDLAIGGFTAGTGTRADSFGALLLGRWTNDGRLEFAGGVGTGFSRATLEELRRRLEPLAVDQPIFDPIPPPSHRRGAVWVRPELTARVEVAEITNDGSVRHASFVSLV